MAQGVTLDFNANVARFSSAIDKATADLNKFQSNADRMAKNVKGAFGGLAAGLSVAAFTAYGKSVLNAADQLQDLSDRTDVAVKDLASLVQASKLADTNIEDVGKSIARLNLSFSQAQAGSKETAAALQRLGITSNDSRERFFQLADAYANASDKNAVLADLQKVLGKSYTDMLPLLKQGGDALREQAAATESFADSMARLSPHAAEFNDNLDKLQVNAAGLTANLLTDLVPALNDITGAMRDAYEQGGLLESLWVGLGGLGTLAFTDQLDSVDKKIRDAEADVKALRAALNDPGIGFMKYGALGDAELVKRIGDTNAKIGELMRERQAMIDAAKDKPKQNSPATTPKPTAVGGSKADPLASLLGSTEIGRLKEFDEKVAQLNARFDYGRKSTELYEQAMTKLVETTFANNFKQAANDAEFMAMVEADGARTAAEWAQNLRDLNNVNMNRLKALLDNTDFAKIEQDQQDMILLTQAFTEGIKDADGNLKKLSEAEYLDAVKNRLKLVGEEGKETKSIFEEMGSVMVSHFEDAISSGKDFGDVLKALEQDLINLIVRMSVTEPLMNGIQGMFSGGGSSGGGFDLGGLFTSAIDWLFSAKGNAFASGNVHAFANGGILGPLGGLLNKPTVFPMANGGIGIGGEAGTEAVMPLMRMGNGKLGVYAANDGGGASVQVNVINNANGTQATASERTDSNGNRIVDVLIEQVKGSIASDISQGRGSVPAALAGTYGLNRVAGSY